jgi:hypothetical protein
VSDSSPTFSAPRSSTASGSVNEPGISRTPPPGLRTAGTGSSNAPDDYVAGFPGVARSRNIPLLVNLLDAIRMGISDEG